MLLILNSHDFHVLELWIEMIVYDPCSFQQYLSSSKKGLKKSGLKRDLNPDLNAMPM